MGEFQKVMHELDSLRCERCVGYGKVDDAEPGDISFNEWECPDCKGTGFKDKIYKLTLEEE